MPQILLFRSLIVGLLVFVTACHTDRPTSEEEQSVDSTRVEYRLKAVNDRIQANPNDPALYSERASINARRGVYPAAVSDMQQAIRLDSVNAGYHLALADYAFLGLQIPVSVNAFRKCLELDPDNKEACLKFAELNLYLKAYPDALKYANDALKSDNRMPKPYFIKGFVYKEMKDTARAISSFQTVVELDPDQYDAYIQLGNIFSAKGNPLAVQYYGNALRVRPGSTEAYYNRGLFLQNIGRLDQAEADYMAILKLDPRYADAHFNLGYIDLVLRNDPSASLDHFNGAIRCNPDYVEAYYNRGMAYSMTGNKEAAKKDFMKTLSIYPAYKLAQERLKEMGVK
jgi:tetratricopeptide (TPR) repeat protein